MALETPKALLDSASRLLRAGRVPEAIEAHERLLERCPQLADSWYNLGYLQGRARRYEASLVSYRRALKRGIGCPEEVHLNLAVVLATLGRTDEAERELDTALELNPKYVPALLNLGNIHEQRGERDPALVAYEKILEIDPTNALALARLPNLKPMIGAQDPLIARLRRAIVRPGARADERADLGFGLGKALDSVGAYDEAFAAYAAANRASRLSARQIGVRYDASAHERFVDALIHAFPQPAIAATAAAGTLAPIFICGMFRSGSSLVEQILVSHPRVTAGGEIDILPMIAKEHLGPHLREPFAPIGEPMLEHLRAIYLDGVSARFVGAEVMTDKRPDNFLYIGLIKALFPSAKIVHTRRSPMDNCLSVFFLHLSHSMPYALDLLDAAHWYRQYQRLMVHWTSLYGRTIHDVDYDGLVAEPRPAIQRLLNYCELPWDDSCLAFHKTRSVVMTPSAWQVRQPLYTRSSGRWRHYARHLDALRAALAA